MGGNGTLNAEFLWFSSKNKYDTANTKVAAWQVGERSFGLLDDGQWWV